jgi:hypothetical protein
VRRRGLVQTLAGLGGVAGTDLVAECEFRDGEVRPEAGVVGQVALDDPDASRNRTTLGGDDRVPRVYRGFGMATPSSGPGSCRER